MINRKAFALKPAKNISYRLQGCVRLKWGKSSSQRSMNKSLGINPLDVNMLQVTIHGQPVNSFFSKVNTG